MACALHGGALHAFKGELRFPPDYPEKNNALLWVEKDGVDLLAGRKKVDAVINQKDMAFHPHVSVLSQGSTLHITNDDPTIHGVKAQGGPLRKLHVIMTPKRRDHRMAVKELGISEILCDIHAQMRAWVVVLPTHEWSLTDAQGKFELKTLPDFPFTLKIWHPVLPALDFKIENAKALANFSVIQMKTW